MNDYHLIDSGDFKKLEQVGSVLVSRPSPQAVWSIRDVNHLWRDADAHYERFTGGGGEWRCKKGAPKSWTVNIGPNAFGVKLTDFGHLGFFPEQEKNWFQIQDEIQTRRSSGKEFRLLNLFGYTGGTTFAAARAGAEVVHVDASKTSVAWARENAELNGLGDRPIRWIVDDVQKFVAREVRREKTYQAIVLDPPSFGRGAQNEVWKIEEHLIPLLDNLRRLFADDFQLMLISGHSPGYTPAAFTNLLHDYTSQFQGRYQAEEMLVAEKASERQLPSGACCWFLRD